MLTSSRVMFLACVRTSVPLVSDAKVNWAQPGMNAQHAGYNSKENVLNSANVGSLTLAWTQTTNAEIVAPIVMDHGKLFVLSTDGTLYAYNTKGKLAWSVVVNQNGARSNWGVIASGSTVFANCQIDYDGAGHGGVCAYTAKTGTILWSYAIFDDGVDNPVDSAPYGPPVLDGDNIAFGQSATASFGHVGYFVVLDAKTGTPVSSIGNCGDTGGNACNPISSGVPAAQRGTVYYDSGEASAPQGYSAAFLALSEATAAINWHIYTTDVGVAPTVANGKVLYHENNNDGVTSLLVALNRATGAQLWSTQVQGADNGHIAPAVANGRAYFTAAGNLYALSLKKGKAKWSYSGTGAEGQVTTACRSPTARPTHNVRPPAQICACSTRTRALTSAESAAVSVGSPRRSSSMARFIPPAIATLSAATF